MEEKKSNWKVFWYVILAFIAVVLCYLFVVIYFFYISPNNISLKLGFWPFLSDQTVGEMYLDATVELNFKANEEFDVLDKSVVGVNIREDGYIIAPYNEFRNYDSETGIKVKTNSGKVYNGVLLYSDMTYNLAVIKCEVISEESAVKMPFVKIANTTGRINSEMEVLAIASPLKSKNIWHGNITDSEMTNVYRTQETDNYLAVDFVIENCYTVDITDEAYTGGAIFNKAGYLLGLSFGDVLEDTENTYMIMPVEAINLFLDDVVDCYRKDTTYTNPLTSGVVGFDKTELYCHIQTSSYYETNVSITGNLNYFYFNGAWVKYSDSILDFHNSQTIDGFYLYQDFVYNGGVIVGKNSVITKILYNDREYSLHSKVDLFNILYGLKNEQQIEVVYYYMSEDPFEQRCVLKVQEGQ